MGIDVDQPRIPGINLKTRFRHYLNLHRTEARIRRLLEDFEWGRMDEIFLCTQDGAPDGRFRRGQQTSFSSIDNRQAFVPEDSDAMRRWDAFVFQCPEATFFHRAGWQEIVSGVFRHTTYFLYAERDGAIEGVLPLAHVKSLLF